MSASSEGGPAGGWRQVMAPFGRERRMHARAHDYWTSLLDGDALPPLSALDPQRLAPFADHGVLIELAGPGVVPNIAFLGRSLREEAEIADVRPGIADLPAGSLLAELIAHLPELIAHHAPASLQVERRAADGTTRLHRGVLLPFADAKGRLAAVYGVMSWWEPAASELVPEIGAAVAHALRSRPADRPRSPWTTEPTIRLARQSIEQQLAAARTWAVLAKAELAGPASIHGALGAAYDLWHARRAGEAASEPDAAALVADVFGTELAPETMTLYATVLDRADRLGIGAGQLVDRLDRHSGGVAGFAEAVIPPPTEAQPFEIAPIEPDFLWRFGIRPPPAQPSVALPKAERATPRRRAAG